MSAMPEVAVAAQRLACMSEATVAMAEDLLETRGRAACAANNAWSERSTSSRMASNAPMTLASVRIGRTLDQMPEREVHLAAYPPIEPVGPGTTRVAPLLLGQSDRLLGVIERAPAA